MVAPTRNNSPPTTTALSGCRELAGSGNAVSSSSAANHALLFVSLSLPQLPGPSHPRSHECRRTVPAKPPHPTHAAASGPREDAIALDGVQCLRTKPGTFCTPSSSVTRSKPCPYRQAGRSRRGELNKAASSLRSPRVTRKPKSQLGVIQVGIQGSRQLD